MGKEMATPFGYKNDDVFDQTINNIVRFALSLQLVLLRRGNNRIRMPSPLVTEYGI